MSAAIELFQRQGVHGTSLEEICADADVSIRTFFNHFETRELLHEAIARQRATQLGALLDEWSSKPEPFATKFEQLFLAIGAFLQERPAYRDFVGEMLRLRPSRGNESIRTGSLGEAAGRFISAGVERDEVTSAHAPEVLADLMLGAITIAVSNWSADEDYDLACGLENAASALLDLLSVKEGK